MCLFLVPGGKMEINKAYLKSIPGILGIVQVVINLTVYNKFSVFNVSKKITCTPFYDF